MKTAISLPEQIFREADQFARRAKKTRSRLYSEAIAEYLARHSPDTITEDLNRVADTLGQQDVAFVRQAAKGVLAEAEW